MSFQTKKEISKRVLNIHRENRHSRFSDIFFKHCFLKTLFSLDGDTLKSYNSKAICLISVKFGQLKDWPISNKSVLGNLTILKLILLSHFCVVTP